MTPDVSPAKSIDTPLDLRVEKRGDKGRIAFYRVAGCVEDHGSKYAMEGPVVRKVQQHRLESRELVGVTLVMYLFACNGNKTNLISDLYMKLLDFFKTEELLLLP